MAYYNSPARETTGQQLTRWQLFSKSSLLLEDNLGVRVQRIHGLGTWPKFKPSGKILSDA